MSEQEARSALSRLAEELATGGAVEDMVLVGIRRRGDHLAELLAGLLASQHGLDVPTGSLDITLYRDDFAQIGPRPVIGATEIPVDISGRLIVIVDDVLFTGRTIRAALNELADFGRARRTELCVLVDRGGRELPIQAEYVGLKLEAGEGEQVVVHVPALDGELAVCLHSGREDA